jgi:myo-inositol-1(or 4)-monophosphatase
LPSDWLALARGAAEDVRAVLDELPTRAEREPVLSQGEGGDDTTAIDAAAERVILARFEGLDATIVSEEIGERGSGRTRVVIDPIDGSLNAKRGIPFFSLSIAVAEGDTMDDVGFAFVHDFGSGEEWVARRGEGVFLNGEPLGPQRPKDRIELLAFEATLTREVADKAAAFNGVAHRIRIMGSLALSLCHLAAGRLDAVCSLKPYRSVDVAAGQLLVRERRLAIANVDGDARFEDAPLDLVPRSRIAAAGTDELCRQVIDRLSV